MKKIGIFLFCLILFSSCKSSAKTDDVYDYVSSKYIVITDTKKLSSVLTQKNAVYEINTVIDLQNRTITIPENSTLYFTKNGSLENGSVKFLNTKLSGNPDFRNINLSGKIKNKQIQLKWFNLITSAQIENSTKQNAILLSKIISCASYSIIVDKMYPLGELINIKNNIVFIGSDWTLETYSDDYNYSYEPECGFFKTGFIINSDINHLQIDGLFNMENSAEISLYGIKLTGFKNLYSGYEFDDAINFFAISSSIFNAKKAGSVRAVYNCRIEGFTEGIYSIGSYIEKIQNTTFDSCRFGLYAVWTSDFDIFSCRFINCGGNYSLNLPQRITKDNIASIKTLASGIYISSTGMINANNNYFENNLIGFSIIDSNIILNIQKSVFKDNSFIDIFSLSAINYIPTITNEDLGSHAINCVSIGNNTFLRTKQNLLNANIFIREADQRGTNIVVSENVFKDSYTNSSDDDCVFLVSTASTKEGCGIITCANNDFSQSKAKSFVKILPTYVNSNTKESEGVFIFEISENKYNQDIEP